MSIKTLNVAKELAKVGYLCGRRESIAVAGMLSQRGGMRGAVIFGPPGCGKTALAESVARMLDGVFLYRLLHRWSDSDELFYGVDASAAVAGRSEDVSCPGVLLTAARLSRKATRSKPVVVLLDEIDKASDHTEALLLDWLQTGRVPVSPWAQEETVMDNVLCFITSNNMRPLSDPLLRRVRRIQMEPLPPATTAKIVRGMLRLRTGLADVVAKAANLVEKKAGTNGAELFVSPQEQARMIEEIINTAESAKDVEATIMGWVPKIPDHTAFVAAGFDESVCAQIYALSQDEINVAT